MKLIHGRWYWKFRRFFKKYFSTNILFLSYFFTSVIMGFLLRFCTLGSVSDFRGTLSDVIVIIVIGSFGYLIKPLKQFRYFFVCSIVFTVICVVNAIYYDFYSSYVSFSLISTLSMLGQVADSVTTKLKLIYFIYLIGPLWLGFVNKVLVKKNYYYEVGKDEKGSLMFRNTLLAGIVLLVILISTLKSSDGSKLVKLWNRDYVVKRFGVYGYTLVDLVQSISPSISPLIGEDEARNSFNLYYNSKDYSKESNLYTGVYEGKNVVFVHMESIQNFLIGLSINGQEVTPNLNKLVKESMYFSKFYPQISVGTSSDTEFTLSTGILPSSSGTVFVNYYNRTYETMEKAFKKKGYYTFAMHANERSYWNRENMYKTLGYDRFYAKNDLDVPLDKSDSDFIGLGLSDSSFFKQITPIIKSIDTEYTNYMGKVITLSNHSPFNDTSKYGEFDLSYRTYVDGEEVVYDYLEGTDMGNYIKSAHYADKALGEFISLIKENKLDEDTVFIFYGDHEAKLGKKNLNLLFNYDPVNGVYKDSLDSTYVNLDNYGYEMMRNTPLVIYTSNIESKEISDVMGMWDVFPTISNMFNLECNYSLGNDIFSNKDKIVVFSNGDVITNKVYYNNLRDEYVSLNGEVINNQYIEYVKEYSSKSLDVSKGIIVYDLLYKEGKVK